MTKEIQLTQGKIALIDNGDFENVSQYKWYAHKNGRTFYARSTINGEKIYLHDFLNNPPDGLETDHKDNDGLNCTRSNLRSATNLQNKINSSIRQDNTSGYKGVSRGRNNKWKSYIKIDGIQKHLGTFDSAEAAALAYDDAARKLYGEFANANFD